MKNKRKEFALSIAMAVVLAIFALTHKQCVGEPRTPKEFKKIATIDSIVYDTVKVYVPVPQDSVVVRYKVVKLPLYCPEKDTCKLEDAPDSSEVIVPIVRKFYYDSLFYASVSGYNVSLDTIAIYPKTVYTSVEKQQKKKKFGVGVNAGYGFNGAGMSPYVGVGVHYNIFSW